MLQRLVSEGLGWPGTADSRVIVTGNKVEFLEMRYKDI